MTTPIGTVTTNSNGVATIQYTPTSINKNIISATNTANNSFKSITSNNVTVNCNKKNANCNSLDDWTIYHRGGSTNPTISSYGLTLVGNTYLFLNNYKTTTNCTINATVNASNLSTTGYFEIGFSTKNTSYYYRPDYLSIKNDIVKVCQENSGYSELYTQNLSNSSNTDIPIKLDIVNNICTATLNNTKINYTFNVATDDFIVFNNGYESDSSPTLKNLSIEYK